MLCLKSLKSSAVLHHTRICIFKFARVTGVLDLILLFQAVQGEPLRFPEEELHLAMSEKLSIAIILLSWAGEERIITIQ